MARREGRREERRKAASPVVTHWGPAQKAKAASLAEIPFQPSNRTRSRFPFRRASVYKASLTSSVICLRPCWNVPSAIWMPPLARLPAFQIDFVNVRGGLRRFHRILRPVLSYDFPICSTGLRTTMRRGFDSGRPHPALTAAGRMRSSPGHYRRRRR